MLDVTALYGELLNLQYSLVAESLKTFSGESEDKQL